MKTQNTYNGYANWSQWNQSLWLNNDEGLYRLMVDALASCKGDKRKAANRIKADLPSKTPDGASWSIIGIVNAMQGL